MELRSGRRQMVLHEWRGSDDPQTKGGNSKSYLIYDCFMQGAVKGDKRVKDSTVTYLTLSHSTTKLHSKF